MAGKKSQGNMSPAFATLLGDLHTGRDPGGNPT
jgi:hypothetical protein